jgi:hypothetical protein
MMMGPSGKALAAGPESVTGNPALLSPGFSAAGGRWNLQTTGVSVAGGFSGGSSLSFGAAVTYLGRGGMIRRDESGLVTGEYSYSTGTACAGASFSILPWLRAGGSAGIAWENIDEQTGTGITASAGLAADIGGSGTAGVAVTGLGVPPEWNGVSKAMPVEVSAGASWKISRALDCFGGTTLGFSTSSSFGGGLSLDLTGLRLSAGYRFSPGEEEITGVFSGIQYTYTSSGTYIIEAAVSQRDRMDWPVLAGISVRL